MPQTWSHIPCGIFRASMVSRQAKPVQTMCNLMHKEYLCYWPQHLPCLDSVLLFSDHLSFSSLLIFQTWLSRAGSCSAELLFHSRAGACPVPLGTKPCGRVCPLVSLRRGGGDLKSSISRITARAITGCYSVLMLGFFYYSRHFFVWRLLEEPL